MLLFKSYLWYCRPKKNLILCSQFVPCFFDSHSTKARFSNVATDPAVMRRGTGGRSSFNGLVVTVFGATGFLGKYVVNQLGKIGSQIVIPYRGTTETVQELRLMGDLGQVMFVHFDPNKDDDIRKAVKYSNVVVNLIGKEAETSHFSHEKVHVEVCGRIAKISKEMGVEKLIHMSALNATPTPKPFLVKKGCSFLRTKALGEIEVRNNFPDAVIIRPSDMYGHNDNFLQYYSRTDRRFFILFMGRYIPLWRKGKETFKQPVHAGDVAKGLVYAVQDPSCKGLTIEAAGPNRYRLDHLVWWILMTLQYDIQSTRITDTSYLMLLKSMLYERMKRRYPSLMLDKLERECHSDTLLGLPNLLDLNVKKLTTLEDRIYYELRYRRRFSYYWSGVDEFGAVPVPPKVFA